MKVFITIGSQEPFDRLLLIADAIAADFLTDLFIAQSVKKDFSANHIKVVSFIPNDVFLNYLKEADLIISHAGIGTIINVLELEKPLIVFPRRAIYQETRDDHQLHTAKAFVKLGYLHMAEDQQQLSDKISQFKRGDLKPLSRIKPYASKEILNSIEHFIENNQ